MQDGNFFFFSLESLDNCSRLDYIDIRLCFKANNHNKGSYVEVKGNFDVEIQNFFEV